MGKEFWECQQHELRVHLTQKLVQHCWQSRRMSKQPASRPPHGGPPAGSLIFPPVLLAMVGNVRNYHLEMQTVEQLLPVAST